MVYSHHIYPVYLTHAETYCFSVNHAGKDFIRYNLKVNGGKFGMDETKSDGWTGYYNKSHMKQDTASKVWT